MNMTEQQRYSLRPGGETIFTVPGSSVKFGPGALREVGEDARALDLKRVGLFTDKHVVETTCFAILIGALKDAGVEAVVYDGVRVEPTDQSFQDAAEFASEEDISGFISLGGGSVIDTAKVANLLSCYPDDLMTYVNAPIGQAKAVPGHLKPHIACPTTSGTGSETTGVAVFDLVASQVKTGISSHFMRPALAVVDPLTTDTLPPGVIAATGFDVLTHALESFTRPYTSRDFPAPGTRPPYQGANPFSDLGGAGGDPPGRPAFSARGDGPGRPGLPSSSNVCCNISRSSIWQCRRSYSSCHVLLGRRIEPHECVSGIRERKCRRFRMVSLWLSTRRRHSDILRMTILIGCWRQPGPWALMSRTLPQLREGSFLVLGSQK